jgi:hypothetical protein
MQNTIQPFVNLANANIAVFTRFAQSPEVAELTQDAIQKTLAVTQDSLSKVSRTNAFTEYSRTLVENYARFVQEYTANLYSVAAQSQAFLSNQVEQGTRRLGQWSDLAGQATARSANLLKASTEQGANVMRNLAESGAEAVKQTADNAVEEVERFQKTAADRSADAVKQASASIAHAAKGAVDPYRSLKK